MDNDLLSRRVAKLERQLSFWRVLVVFLAILCAVSVTSHLSAAPSRIDATAVVAQEFDLVNAAGRVTARFAPLPDNPDSPYLVLKYPNDKAAISLGVEGKSASSVSLLNSDGNPRAIMNESVNGPAVTLFDEDSRIRIEVDALRPGPQISTYDRARKRTVVAFNN